MLSHNTAQATATLEALQVLCRPKCVLHSLDTKVLLNTCPQMASSGVLLVTHLGTGDDTHIPPACAGHHSTCMCTPSYHQAETTDLLQYSQVSAHGLLFAELAGLMSCTLGTRCPGEGKAAYGCPVVAHMTSA